VINLKMHSENMKVNMYVSVNEAVTYS